MCLGIDNVGIGGVDLGFETVAKLGNPPVCIGDTVCLGIAAWSTQGEVILCAAKVECIEDQIAVVSGQIKSAENNQVLASAIGSFMIGTRATPLADRVVEAQ